MTVASRSRLIRIWRRAVALAAPVSVEAVLRTSMRTTDVLVAGFVSPGAVAAVGVGDSFTRIVNHIGSALGGATIALSSQDTGSESFENRDEAITQAILLGFLVGIPFIAIGYLFSRAIIDLIGAEAEVVVLGGQYLGLILMAAPMIHVSRIGIRAVQGTGDTKTPMYVRGFANVVNILGTVVLALGLGPFPKLSVVGIALATVVGETATALLILVAIYRPSSGIDFTVPSNLTISKQIVSVSLPRFGEGGAVIVSDIPFNAVLLAISTEATAAYHIGRRVYQQLIAPIYRGFRVAANVLVGQTLGDDRELAYVNGIATNALGMGIAVVPCVVLFVAGAPLVELFASGSTTAELAFSFMQAFAVAGIFHVAFTGFQGALRGGSETRSPFVAAVVGMFVFLLGVSYVGGIVLGYGVLAVYVAIVANFAARTVYLGLVYYRRNWIDRGVKLMEDRGSLPSPSET